MATEAHTIYSHYTLTRALLPPQASTLHGDRSDDQEAAWETEISDFGLNPRLIPPTFVPAKRAYDDWGALPPQKVVDSNDGQERGHQLAGWYSSITNTATASSSQVLLEDQVSPLTSPPVRVEPTKERRTKNNWFIMKAMDAQHTPQPAPSLADILQRDPPPLAPGEFTPKVFLTIGPSNRGFTMLENQGWNEGEGLGKGVRRTNSKWKPIEKPAETLAPAVRVKEEAEMEVEVQWSNDVQEIRKVDLIDLTLTDDEDSSEKEEEDEVEELVQSPTSHPPQNDPYAPKALITPIAVVLKSDRLGLGLKAKTEGPYKSSQKRVTHGAAAIAANLRAAEQVRRQKQQVGRGARGFAKQSKRESARRKDMLAMLNG